MNSNYINIVVGFLFSLAISIIVVLLNSCTGTLLHSFSIWFIIPIGSVGLGYLGSLGYVLIKKKTGLKFTYFDYLIIPSFAVLTYFMVNYITYLYGCIDLNGKISVFTSYNNLGLISERFSFIDFLGSINYEILGNSTGESVAITFIVVQSIGSVIGGVFQSFTLKNHKYCESCKKYYSKKEIMSFKSKYFDLIFKDFNANLEDNGLGSALSNLKKHDIVNDDEDYGLIELFYCNGCFESYVEINFYEYDLKKANRSQNYDDKYNLLHEKKITLNLKKETIKSYLN